MPRALGGDGWVLVGDYVSPADHIQVASSHAHHVNLMYSIFYHFFYLPLTQLVRLPGGNSNNENDI